MSTEIARICEACCQKVAARFRTLTNLFMCDDCYAIWRDTGKVPAPTVDETERAMRW